jgi:hypothetical protein
VNGYPQSMLGTFVDGSRKYRLRGGTIGTYLEACRECLKYWKRKKEETEERIRHFEQEIASDGRAMTVAEPYSAWELESGHRAERHMDCDRTACPICEGGLTYCVICGGSEGSLLPRCPGKQLTAAEDEQNYADYCAGTGPFAGKGRSE